MSSESSKNKTLALVQSVLLIVVGILVICAVIDIETILQYIVAIALTVLGCYLLFDSVYRTKYFISAGSLGGGILLGVGIACFANEVIRVSSFFTEIVQVGILCTGILLLVQAVINLVQKKATVFAIIYLVLGLIAIIFGSLLLAQVFKENTTTVTYVIAGILLISIGSLNLVGQLTGANKK